MTIGLANPLRTARANQVVSFLDADTNPGKINLYTAPRPAKGAAVTTQTLLGTCVLSKPSGTVANGVLTLATVSDDVSADATGDIAWARLTDGAGAFVADASCGLSTSTEDLTFNTLSAVLGGTIKVTGGTLTEGNN